MHRAAYKQFPSVVQYLVDQGATVDLSNTKNKAGVIMTAEGVSTVVEPEKVVSYGSQVRATTSKFTTLIASASPLFIRNPVARIVWPRCAAGLGNTFIKLTSRVPELGGGA